MAKDNGQENGNQRGGGRGDAVANNSVNHAQAL